MNEQDQKIMAELFKNREKYYIFVDNDDVSVYLRDGDECFGTFQSFGYFLLNEVFQYLGFDSELA